MIVLIDNYDSFSYNLYQLLGAVRRDIRVIRNDAMSVPELEALSPEALVLSPGPGRPADAGICEEAVRALSGRVPILGVCLGHQAICEAFGGEITYAREIMHGKSSLALANADCPLFEEVRQPMEVGRYHSLEVAAETLPACLRVTAETEDGAVMAVQHVSHPTFGLQFHPESILTPTGEQMAQGFMALVG
ncbi:MAG: aminodeoxychorismate/anthranilate synthase component II [Acidobacteriota bacterium]|nr:aminodeoxychorismate/anthranilate synthase component II [Acidobacteriota bacterium]